MFFKKEIRVTRDLSECNRIRNLLEAHDVMAYVITNTPTNPGRYHGAPFIDSSAAYQYHIYVKAKDVDMAKRVLCDF